MKLQHGACLLGAAFALFVDTMASPLSYVAASLPGALQKRYGVVKPKLVIISMFPPEAEVWYGKPEFNVLANNVTVPGLSPLYPDVHCTAKGDVCQITIGESGMSPRERINSA
jgi:purine nucleoside permease